MIYTTKGGHVRRLVTETSPTPTISSPADPNTGDQKYADGYAHRGRQSVEGSIPLRRRRL